MLYETETPGEKKVEVPSDRHLQCCHLLLDRKLVEFRENVLNYLYTLG